MLVAKRGGIAARLRRSRREEKISQKAIQQTTNRTNRKKLRSLVWILPCKKTPPLFIPVLLAANGLRFSENFPTCHHIVLQRIRQQRSSKGCLTPGRCAEQSAGAGEEGARRWHAGDQRGRVPAPRAPPVRRVRGKDRRPLLPAGRRPPVARQVPHLLRVQGAARLGAYVLRQGRKHLLQGRLLQVGASFSFFASKRELFVLSP
ncbi:hypothetical protein CDAR_318531 [Caerostris darwini]|uniref:Uncharacterized protein n=1 Tax=Caerostris darwini TaxID=1538125 RepID=A0AAV4Q729_9ARAC|nr:hypothetical protein CDAR_318531 [Caerostris darwini]